jgi:hypothetical protein
MDELPEGPIDRTTAENLEIEVKDHLEKDVEDECAYCGQYFPPDEVVIEKIILGRKWRFCSEQCVKDFQDASNFKDQDLDSGDDLAADTEVYDQHQDEKEDEI